MATKNPTYRVFTRRLRVQRGPGNSDLVVERPLELDARGNEVGYADSDEKPTLVTFDDKCQVDVASLLANGAIAEYSPPEPPAKKGD